MTPSDLAYLIANMLDNSSGFDDEGYFSATQTDTGLDVTYYDDDGGLVAAFSLVVER